MLISYFWWLLLALLIAIAWSFWQYKPTQQKQKKLFWGLFLLRGLAVFGVLLLLINPIITKNQIVLEKAPLFVLLDNSASIKNQNQDKQVQSLKAYFASSKTLSANFDLQILGFDQSIISAGSLTFDGKHTDLGFLGKHIKDLALPRAYPVIVVTDGNQTKGKDYVYGFYENQRVFPVVVGDTTQVLDWKLEQINHNKYSLYQNKFPVEVLVSYQGKTNSTAQVLLKKGNQVIQKKALSLSKNQKSGRVEWLVEANALGLQTYEVEVVADLPEKNVLNNRQFFAVEVIDQKKTIGLVSNIVHPDIGALHKAIGANEFRTVKILKPNDVSNLEDFSALILYQPDVSFRSLLTKINEIGLNYWLISGKHTDFELVNAFQPHFSFKSTNQKEDYLASYHANFKYFGTENIGYDQFPPLEHPFGNLTLKTNHEILLYAKIRNVVLEQPLLSLVETPSQKAAYLFGENLWKWRVQSHLSNKNFEVFDTQTDKIIQYISSNDTKKRLTVEAASFYNQNDNIQIKATFFDKNYQVDTNTKMQISLKQIANNIVKKYQMYQGSQGFFINFDDLEAGSYDFVVTEENSKISQKGEFKILPFDAEKQFVQANFQKLEQLALQQQGAVFMPNEVGNLVNKLTNEPIFPIVEKTQTTRTQLIDWYWLLLLIVTSLAAEWFIRKYHGLL